MMSKYELETILKNSLLRFDGMISQNDGSVHTVYEASIEDLKDGSFIFSFKEDFRDEYADRYKITVDYVKE